MIKEHDTVRLLTPVNGWDAGTVGAVVSDYGDAAMVEISNSDGEVLDLPVVAKDKLELVE